MEDHEERFNLFNYDPAMGIFDRGCRTKDLCANQIIGHAIQHWNMEEITDHIYEMRKEEEDPWDEIDDAAMGGMNEIESEIEETETQETIQEEVTIGFLTEEERETIQAPDPIFHFGKKMKCEDEKFYNLSMSTNNTEYSTRLDRDLQETTYACDICGLTDHTQKNGCKYFMIMDKTKDLIPKEEAIGKAVEITYEAKAEKFHVWNAQTRRYVEVEAFRKREMDAKEAWRIMKRTAIKTQDDEKMKKCYGCTILKGGFGVEALTAEKPYGKVQVNYKQEVIEMNRKRLTWKLGEGSNHVEECEENAKLRDGVELSQEQTRIAQRVKQECGKTGHAIYEENGLYFMRRKKQAKATFYNYDGYATTRGSQRGYQATRRGGRGRGRANYGGRRTTG